MKHLLVAALTVVASSVVSAQPPSDAWLKRPVDDRTFAAFKSFYTYDRRLPLEAQVIDRDTTGGLLVEHLSYQSTPGIRVTARTYSMAATSSQRRAAVVLLHGGGAPGKDAAGVRFAGDYLARAGFLVLTIDMQFFGERSGSVLTTFTEEEKHQKLYNQPAAYLAWVMQTIKDVGRGYDLLVDRFGADPKRIGLVGFSRGAILGIVVGGADPRIAAVVASYGGHFDALETSHEAAACPANYIGRLAPRGLYMVNGTNDTDMFRDASVLPLQRLAKDPKKIVWLETGHILPREEFPSIANWLQEKLR